MNKDFNLELCMTRDGGRCKTRDGRDVRIIWTDRKYVKFDYPIVALVGDSEEGEVAAFYAVDGSYTNGITSRHDLVNLTVKKQKWINVYKEDLDRIYNSRKYHDSEEEALVLRCESLNYIKTILIHEWEE